MELDGIAIEVSGNGVGQNRLADVEARLQLLEHRMVQMQIEMSEDMASLYHAGTLQGRLISKLMAHDLVLIPLGIAWAMQLVPPAVLVEWRARA